ncbi:arylacetamide deacetylase-like [Ptychodera flava]|uniref:arylacetamide deacetylase-like n=1 Tax=Ptychodera flava TaxID=63121 RepID=UPI00396A4F3E
MGFFWNVTWKSLLVLTVYFFYTPMPSGISNPMRVTLLSATARASNHVGSLVQYLGWGTKVHVRRYLFELAHRRKQDSGNIRSYDTEIADVPVRVYEPVEKTQHLLPAIVYFHGGAMMFGSADSYDETTRSIATALDIKVISVGYRLAPEHPFPIPLQDCLAVTKDVLLHAEDYEIDVNNVAIAGDSAGGNLAAAVAQKVYALSGKEKLPGLKFQGLIYPALQALNFNLPSHLQNARVLSGVLDREQSLSGRLQYAFGGFEADPELVELILGGELLRKVAESDKAHLASYVDAANVPAKFKQRENAKNASYSEGHPVPQKLVKTFTNPSFMPLMKKDLRGLADTYILTVEFDILRDEGILYADRLQQSGVEVTWDHIESGFHGIFSLGESYEAGKEAREKFVDYARSKFSL